MDSSAKKKHISTIPIPRELKAMTEGFRQNTLINYSEFIRIVMSGKSG